MRALTLSSVFWELDHLMTIGLQAGVLVTGTTSPQAAQDILLRNHIDILIIDARCVGPLLTYFLEPDHSLNKNIACVLRSDHVAQDQRDLPFLYPSLHAIVDRALPVETALQMVLAAFRPAQLGALGSRASESDFQALQPPSPNLPPLTLAR